MARKHPSKVIAFIHAQAQGNVQPAEIDRRLRAGECPGVGPYEMPRRSIQEHAQRARRDLDPLPETVVDTATAIEMSALRIVNAEVKRLRAIADDEGGLPQSEAKTLREHVNTAQLIRRDRQRRAEAPHPDRVAGGKAAGEAKVTKPESMLDRIASTIEEQPASPPPNTTQTNGENGALEAEAESADSTSDDHAGAHSPPRAREHETA